MWFSAVLRGEHSRIDDQTFLLPPPPPKKKYFICTSLVDYTLFLLQNHENDYRMSSSFGFKMKNSEEFRPVRILKLLTYNLPLPHKKKTYSWTNKKPPPITIKD